MNELSEEELRKLAAETWKYETSIDNHGMMISGEYYSPLPERAAAEIRRLRLALSERDALLAKAGEDAAWAWLESQYLDTAKGYHPNDRAYSSDEMVDAFMAGQDHAASLAAELKEKQG